jgi:hypothetical protein
MGMRYYRDAKCTHHSDLASIAPSCAMGHERDLWAAVSRARTPLTHRQTSARDICYHLLSPYFEPIDARMAKATTNSNANGAQ